MTLSGPLAPLFARVIGRNVASGMPVAMQELARLAETAQVARG